MQSLKGKVAVLNRFVSKAIDKCLPFFCTLKKSFVWIAKCQQAFKDIKAYLSSPPWLSPSKAREKLFLYLVVSLAVVSIALVKEENRVQKLVYYTSRGEVPPDGEASICLSDRSSQARTIFLGLHGDYFDRQVIMKNNE